MSNEENIELGGNIELSGFRDLDSAQMIVLKKMVGSYARKFSDHSSDFEKLYLTMKQIHQTEKSEKYEIHGKLLLGGKPYVSEITDRNLFMAVDAVLKKITNEIS